MLDREYLAWGLPEYIGVCSLPSARRDLFTQQARMPYCSADIMLLQH